VTIRTKKDWHREWKTTNEKQKKTIAENELMKIEKKQIKIGKKARNLQTTTKRRKKIL
jgi:hypothetical protein